jgi:hypothetical protein
MSGDIWFSSVKHRYGFSSPQTTLVGATPDFHVGGGFGGNAVWWSPEYLDGSGLGAFPRPLESGDYFGNLAHPFNGRVPYTTSSDPYIRYSYNQTLNLNTPPLITGEDGDIRANGAKFVVGVGGATNVQSDYNRI